MRKFHTNLPWFGEPLATLSEELSVPVPTVGEKAIFPGGRAVHILSVSTPEKYTNGYVGKRYWRVTVEIEVLG